MPELHSIGLPFTSSRPSRSRKLKAKVQPSSETALAATSVQSPAKETAPQLPKQVVTRNVPSELIVPASTAAANAKHEYLTINKPDSVKWVRELKLVKNKASKAKFTHLVSEKVEMLVTGAANGILVGRLLFDYAFDEPRTNFV